MITRQDIHDLKQAIARIAEALEAPDVVRMANGATIALRDTGAAHNGQETDTGKARLLRALVTLADEAEGGLAAVFEAGGATNGKCLKQRIDHARKVIRAEGG